MLQRLVLNVHYKACENDNFDDVLYHNKQF